MLLHVLAHVEADHRLLVVEQELGQGLGGLRLAHARRPEQEERAERARRLLEAGLARGARRDGLEGLVLADDPLAQAVLHGEQLGALGLQQLRCRDAGPAADHLGDHLLVDGLGQQGSVGLQRLQVRALASRSRSSRSSP